MDARVDGCGYGWMGWYVRVRGRGRGRKASGIPRGSIYCKREEDLFNKTCPIPRKVPTYLASLVSR